jgi:hypothetical protein
LFGSSFAPELIINLVSICLPWQGGHTRITGIAALNEAQIAAIHCPLYKTIGISGLNTSSIS